MQHVFSILQFFCNMLYFFNGWIMTTLIVLLVIAGKNRCDVDAGTGCNTLMKMLILTRPSILRGTHQLSRKKTRPSVNYAKD